MSTIYDGIVGMGSLSGLTTTQRMEALSKAVHGDTAAQETGAAGGSAGLLRRGALLRPGQDLQPLGGGQAGQIAGDPIINRAHCQASPFILRSALICRSPAGWRLRI